MPLGTLDRSPPPFFRQGPSALTKLALCSALALLLMVADARFKLMQPVRAGFALVLHPVQRLLLAPVDAWDTLGGYLRGTPSLRLRPLTSISRTSEPGNAEPMPILMASAVCSPMSMP